MTPDQLQASLDALLLAPWQDHPGAPWTEMARRALDWVRDTSIDLSLLEARRADAKKPPGVRSIREQLHVLLDRSHLPADEAVQLLQALGRCVADPVADEAQWTAVLAFRHPAWRTQAILTAPHLFRGTLGPVPRHHTAFTLFANYGWSRDLAPDETEARVAETLGALESIGAEWRVGPQAWDPFFIGCLGRHDSVVTGFVRHFGPERLRTTRDRDGNTVLHAAARHSSREPHERLAAVERLCRLGADARAKNQSGLTPLGVLATSGQSLHTERPVMQALIDASEPHPSDRLLLEELAAVVTDPEMKGWLQAQQARLAIVAADRNALQIAALP